MNIRHKLTQYKSRVLSRLGLILGNAARKPGPIDRAGKNWRIWLNMDLSEVLAGIFSKLNKSSLHAGFRVNNLEGWPLWFRSTVLFLLFVSGFAVIAHPVWTSALSELDYLNAESQVRKARYRHLAMESALLEQNRDRVSVLAVRFGEMLEMIPAELEVVQVLNHFSQIARESGIQLEWFKPETEIQEESYAILPINMRLSGSFPEAARFLEAVSSMKHLVTVDVILESVGSVPGKIILSARVRAYRGDTPRSMVAPAKAVGDIDATY